MDEADPAEALINTLNNMSLIQPQDPSDNAQLSSSAAAFVSEPFQAFSLYPTLPSELRLKILSHSLPSPSTVRTNAHVLISDPSFGLYVTFSISRAGYTRSLSAFQPVPRPGKITAELKATRMIPLLSTTKETRAFYLSHHPIILPSGPNGKGQIRLAKNETLSIDNYPSLLVNAEFSRAIRDDYRLQNLWAQLFGLSIPVETFMHPGHGSYGVLLRLVGKCTGLTTLGAVMWGGFRQGGGDDLAVKGVLVGIEGHLEEFRRRLKKSLDDDFDDADGDAEERRENQRLERRLPKLYILET
ncbi:hypothetical protein IFR04_008283 [Cadophora malorum]|uniref:2EXR domain-containing protein n=1 Tax=Cadophora malorum TaxID=108018 RepID=A0A8H7W7V3_9HELO|nr:hypothetical protein IFR04_008283 [Cadophora malorum]